MSDDDAHQIEPANSGALTPGSTLLSGQYEILQYLSSGGFGITYTARDSLNRTVVIKECFPEAFCSRVNKTVRARTQSYAEEFRATVQLFIREAHAMSRLDHAGVVGVHQVFEDNETAYMALDLIKGKDLLDIIDSGTPKLSADEIHGITLKLLDAIGHVHSQDLLHRDISPDNILLDQRGRPVLIDFGAAREEASRKSRILSAVLVVKDGYSPQEFYVAGSQQSPSSDLYALAATLSHLISGEAPPNSQARLAALANNQPDPYQPLFGRFPAYEDAFLASIDQAMRIIPAERLQSAEDWALKIDRRKRVERARAQADQDKSIDETIMNLVASVQIERRAQGAVEPRTAQGPAPAPASEAGEPDTLRDLGEDAMPADPADSEAGLACCELPDAQDAAHVVHLPAPEAEKPTPYARVTSKAVEAANMPKPPAPPIFTRERIIRAVTAPVIFCAFLLYGQTVLKNEQVQAATLQPLLMWGQGLGGWKASEPAPVTVRRGLGD